MNQIKRTKRIEIRLTDDEYQSLLNRKTKPRLAEWLREVGLDEKPKRKPKPTDPKLLFELNRIGVNLNQIARHLNQQSANVDLIAIAVTLQNIEDELKKVSEVNNRDS